jgi:UDP-N-acetylmuramate--alanine ligase
MTEVINISSVQKAYFIGIGGIGMSALARFFHQQGAVVSGYDRTETDLTKTLIKEGIVVHYDDDPLKCPIDADIVVYTPAIPSDNKIVLSCKERGVQLLKRSDVLQIISRGTYNICIAGTHGKTTTSAMVAHILRDSGYGCNAFLGGISTNYQSNFWSSPNPVAVIEADEYDRSFLKLYPDVISISSMDPDHLDIYGTPEEMESAFIQFAKNIKSTGLLLTKKGLKREGDFKASNHLTYSMFDIDAHVHVEDFSIKSGSYHYSVVGRNWKISGIELNMGGKHNVENSLVAITIAKHLGITDEKIKKAIAGFKGVKRRFEYIIKSEETIYIDDYAHHPEELRMLLTSVKELYSEKKCTVIFQPHLYTRTRDFAEEFARSLDIADRVLLLPVYPARELPIKGVDSSIIADKMKSEVQLVEMLELTNKIQELRPTLLITAGAGDIDKMIQPLKASLLRA